VKICFILAVLLGLETVAEPALAAVEQCRLIQAKLEREACYERQAIALAAKRKSQPSVANTASDAGAGDTTTLESLQQMRQEDYEVYRSMRSICRGC
jgi:hypothetical protein